MMVQLPKLALDVIDAIRKIEGCRYVFWGGAGGRFHNDAAEKARLDARLRAVLPDMKPWVHHDLRRTARSLMAQIGIADPVAEPSRRDRFIT